MRNERLFTVVPAAIAAILFLVAPVIRAGEEEDRKLVNEMFDNKIAAVKATKADDDDISLAKEMLLLANDTTSSQGLRFLLAQKSLQLTLPLASEESTDLAYKAMAIADQLGKLGDVQKAFYVRQISAKAIVRAKSGDKQTFEHMAGLAGVAVEADIKYCRAAMNDEPSAAEVVKALAEARSLVGTYKLINLTAPLDELANQNKTLTARRTTFRELLAKLETAKKDNDDDAIKIHSRAIATAYLEYDGDLRNAAKYLDRTDDPRTKGVLAAAAFLDDPKTIDATFISETLDSLIAAASKLPDIPKGNIATIGLQMAQAYMDGKPSDIAATKVKLQMVQLKTLTAGLQADELRKSLVAGYGSMGAKVEVLDADRARLTYDFSTPTQLLDWDKVEGDWHAIESRLTYSPDKDDDAAIRAKVALRTDKPGKISAYAEANMMFGLYLSSGSSSTSTIGLRSYYSDSYFLQFSMDPQGYRMEGPFGTITDTKKKLQPSTFYKVEYTWDGKGAWTCTLDGVPIKDAKSVGDTVRLCLFTRNAKKGPTHFDNVVFEGTLIVDPKKADVGNTVPQPDDSATGTVKRGVPRLRGRQ